MTYIPFLKPAEGETIYSLVSRYHLLSGHVEYVDTLNELYGKRKKRLHPYLPNQLKLLAKQFSVDLNSLLQDHTLFPLFCLFDPNITSRLKTAMLGESDSTVITAHCPQFKLKFFSGHKYCPACCNEDMHKVGCGIWRIEHQIPGLLACAKHNCYLLAISNADGGLDRNLLSPPVGIEPFNAKTKDQRLSYFALQVLKIINSTSNFPNIKNNYYQQLQDKGLRTPSGTLKIKDIKHELKQYWQGLSFAHKLGIPEKVNSFDFVGPLLRIKTAMPTHPTKHLLFACWLFDSCAESYLQPSNKKIDYKKPTFKGDKVKPQVIKLLKAGLSINKISKKTGKSSCYITHVAELNGINHSTHALKYSSVTKRQVIIKALYGFHRKDIATKLNIGIGYVEQVISNTPNLVKWRKHLNISKKIRHAVILLTQARKEHPNWIRKDLKAKVSAAFFTLYHHNRVLLESILPKKKKPVTPTKDWNKQDERLYLAIQKLNITEKPSLNNIDYAVGGRGYLKKYLQKLPKTQELLNKLGIRKRY